MGKFIGTIIVVIIVTAFLYVPYCLIHDKWLKRTKRGVASKIYFGFIGLIALLSLVASLSGNSSSKSADSQSTAKTSNILKIKSGDKDTDVEEPVKGSGEYATFIPNSRKMTILVKGKVGSNLFPHSNVTVSKQSADANGWYKISGTLGKSDVRTEITLNSETTIIFTTKAQSEAAASSVMKSAEPKKAAPKKAEPKKETKSELNGKATTLSTGIWEVGRDLEPGRYKITAVSGSGNLSDSEGLINAILGSVADPSMGQVDSVTSYLVKGDKLKVEGIPSIKLIPVASNPSATVLGSGNYLVGTDIMPGRYTLTALQGSGNVQTDDGEVNEIMGTTEDSELGQVKTVTTELEKGQVLTIEGVNQLQIEEN
ncbi:hypothetical protein EQG49_11405 [Periweissella cryptocerci]|uniref:Uncharacterized protein n=1 Tax=Periweissella cryptocerci TaxID=2506420 RepID=A0A4P6YW71_9LACO|nr:hypothetical protein [Periweissella cryptocerci]QBO37013.1 hypothetical protein EQG49_11405 [Periweissella cryptocerci]